MQKGIVVPPQMCVQGCHNCSNECEQKELSVLSPEAAIAELLLAIGGQSVDSEIIPLAGALDRVTAEPMFATFNIPEATCAMHDGIAVDWENCSRKWERGERALAADEFIHCPMGSVIPSGFDTLLHAEQCRISKDNTAVLLALPIQYQSVQPQGSSVAEGEKISEAGEKLTPSHLAMLQYAGITQIPVKPRPRISIVAIGNELCSPGSRPQPGENIDCDSIFIQAMARQCGAEAFVAPIVPDSEAEIEAAVERELKQCDILVVIGGVGRGEQNYGDFTVKALRKLGTVLCHGAGISPGGKNLVLACAEGKPVLGIPGPPHAAIIMTERFLPPLIEHYLGCPCYEPQEIEVTLEADLRPRGSSIWIPRLYVFKGDSGYTARVVDRLGDTVDNFVRAMASTTVYGDPEQYKKGRKVKARLLYGEKTLECKVRKMLEQNED
ncbi:putative molybdopterin biosynthesis protein [Desulfitobacterium sp. LBE]|uniref:MoaB/Mog domain-containing protein n=1 Tax=bioreactor metagenome TaxID=1076179 RepID=A0A644TY90_9ZZZZ|nr:MULTISPECIES: molybdopterin molybdotransferase MoeA [Desulfitobacterium]TWH59273.1 putative molybdopterin biosynthesis protein [Desulfitobacterium sp. LBE]